MIRKLRTKFIIIAMTAFIVSTVILVCAINLVNYYFVDVELTQIVEAIASNDGKMPVPPRPVKRENDESDGQQNHDFFRGYRAEMAYETRYFVLHEHEDGSKDVELARIATLTKESALELADRILKENKTIGFYDDYKYLVQSKSDGGKILVVMDAESRLSAVKKLAMISGGTALFGIILMFVFIAVFSKRAIKPVLESSEKQKQFITDASHELKTPLTVIATNMDILAMDLGENEWVQGTQKQVSNLRKLVNHLVSLSRLEEEKTPIMHATFDLERAILEVTEAFGGMAEFEGKQFGCEIQSGLSIKGDENATRQLIAILCDNAVKYAKAQGEIKVTAYKKGKKTVMDISNDCEEKVEEEVLGRLFERFYRADAARTKEEGRGGYGIGLAIAKAIVEKQGGKIRVKQDTDLKIHFTVTLPS
ncbi:MAG: HAMP domain-containing histidine kinase [Lachnospiraceae bacterium]|nr:HAMP domain-containing histidine kinase [Lachnospiraceae bacterium]